MTRARWLFDLASVTHIAPPVVNGLTVADFAQLVVSIQRYHAANQPGR